MGNDFSMKITEIFFSYQGEGIYLGMPQVFIRFAGCNLRCRYCDTVESQNADEGMKLTTDEVIDEIYSVLKTSTPSKKVKYVSLTGGEPLLQTNFLLDLIPKLKRNRLKIYLETNGTLPDKLKKVIDLVDIVAMDIKLPSDCKRNFWQGHRQFLKISSEKKVFIKLVLTKNTENKEVYKSINLIKSIDRNIPLVLQPVTANVNSRAKPENIFRWFSYAQQNLKSVFLTPQMQKYWQIR
ncbi:MAG: hypothetical protein AUJ85_01300 [Elusimicrobia bacterium CG1_02_37_114]|nr:MAG: hypothetical protein AUJ85_01300 [Elusimicrobia bacterium CG1_02_37_114]PIV52669.1 MAG: 7-carboxy-7-deazaguanine synthase QueE [Elusimicrobia bacterium CG02_land_8_20_14_3_00_37_13]PIZ13695.1 MAG: 7-carboxy-7-deazaguanine synthase QueE [Elusimicrobia bacterium CG_4_10_14_0_8_um_filter_37_32]